MNVCIYVCMVKHIARRGRINRVSLPILLVVSWTGKINISLSPFAPENLASQDGFGRPASACSFSTLRLNLVLTQGIPPDFRGGVYLFKPPYAIGSVPSLPGHAISYRRRSLPRVCRHRASGPRGRSSIGCCLCKSPWTNWCMPLLFHTHCCTWHEVGTLKVSETVYNNL